VVHLDLAKMVTTEPNRANAWPISMAACPAPIIASRLGALSRVQQLNVFRKGIFCGTEIIQSVRQDEWELLCQEFAWLGLTILGAAFCKDFQAHLQGAKQDDLCAFEQKKALTGLNLSVLGSFNSKIWLMVLVSSSCLAKS
jgi:hypothetical protein